MAIFIKLDVIMANRNCLLKDLAKAVGITEANLSILKNGKAKAIRLDTLEGICKFLQCQPGDIIQFENTP